MTDLSRITPEALADLHLARPPKEPDVIDLNKLAATLWRGRLLIFVLTLGALILGGTYAFVAATPLFRATSVVMLETRQDQIVDIKSVVGGLSGETSEINSEVEVLRSRSLIGKVVDRLDLINDPEFNPALAPKGSINLAGQRIQSFLGLTSAAMPEANLAKDSRDRVITALLNKVSVRSIPLSLVLQITTETESPEKAARIADAIVAQYVNDQVAQKQKATQEAATWLEDRVAELRIELEQAENAMVRFNATTDLISPDVTLEEERRIKDIRERISLARRNRRATATQVTEGSPELYRLDQQIAALEASELALSNRLARQNQDLITLQQLTREADATRVLYEHFLTRLKETAAQQGLQQADSRILSAAVVPAKASSPRRPQIMLLSLLGGLALGSALVLWRARGGVGFRTPNELERAAAVPVLGQVPRIPGRRRSHVLGYLSQNPASAAAEAVRNLRTSVMMSNVDAPPQVIAMTSSLPGEGKTTNALALAHNLIGLGKSVVLIEGDIRRRALLEYFPDLPARGLVSVFAGELTLDEALYHPQGLGIALLPGEQGGVNAADLFASDRFRALIEELKTRYDVILIDTPPVLVVPDARIIARLCDALLFTVRWDSTSHEQLSEALRMVRNANQKVTGTILSQINPKGMRRYGHGGDSAAYGSYGLGYYSG